MIPTEKVERPMLSWDWEERCTQLERRSFFMHAALVIACVVAAMGWGLVLGHLSATWMLGR